MAQVDTGGGKKGAPHVDMTPMVDLGFLLITFFMLTTTFNKPKAMEVNMPDKEQQKDKQEEMEVPASRTTTVILGEDDKIYYYHGVNEGAPELNETNYSDAGIRRVLLDKKGKVAKPIIIIKPMNASRYVNLIDILDEMTITGMKQYAIVDITPEDVALVKGETDPNQVIEVETNES